MISVKDRIATAKEVSYFYHKFQKYGERPYTYHIDQVVSLLNSWKTLKHPFEVSDEDIIVGYLHDVLEDSYCTEQEIVERHGEEVLKRLKLLSRNYSKDKKMYLNNLKGDVVKIADTVCNLTESLKDNNEKRIYKYTLQLCIISSEDFCCSVLDDYVRTTQDAVDCAGFILDGFKIGDFQNAN